MLLVMVMMGQPQRARSFDFFHVFLTAALWPVGSKNFKFKGSWRFPVWRAVCWMGHLNSISLPWTQFKTDFSFTASVTHLLALPCCLLNPSVLSVCSILKLGWGCQARRVRWSPEGGREQAVLIVWVWPKQLGIERGQSLCTELRFQFS